LIQVDGEIAPLPHVRVLIVAGDLAAGSAWADAVRATHPCDIALTASTGDAWAVLDDGRIDAVLTGYDIEGGVRTFLRDLAFHDPHLPVVVVATLDRDALDGCLALGAVDVVRLDDLERLGRALTSAVKFTTMERTLRDARAELAELSAPRAGTDLRDVVDQIPAIVWTTDDALVVRSMRGWRDDTAMLGTRIGVASAGWLSGQDRSIVLHAHRRALAGESTRFEFVIDGQAQQAHVDPLRDTHGLIVGTIGIAIDVTETRARSTALARLSTHDAMTDLPNRSVFESRVATAVAQARELGRSCAVLMLDVDRFKYVNELGGHGVGDEVLRVLAYRIRRATGAQDTVARFGGDKFVIVYPDLAAAAEARARAEAILEGVRPPIAVGDHQFSLTASIGISVFPDDATDVPTLVSTSEAAMYEAKRLGRNNARFYVPNMLTSPTERLALLADLRRAIELDQLELYYQPMYSVETRAIMGVEALIRWRHPERGLLVPERFIPLAEESGMIERIGEWVIARACDQVRAWNDIGIERVRVSINVSARQLDDESLRDVIYEHIQRTNISAHALEIEITESSIMRDVPAAIRLLCDLKEMGLKVSIDDFGTGYTSLAFLKRFPVDVLKIDRSFVREVATGSFDGAVVRAMTTLAQSMGVRTVAEGVELTAQYECLRDFQCDEVQGFLFSRPLRADACTPLLLGQLR
jgi:diguanylate cyclase (GGDEF)-like protein